MPVGRSLASAESFEDEDVSAELSETVTERMANAIYVHATGDITRTAASVVKAAAELLGEPSAGVQLELELEEQRVLFAWQLAEWEGLRANGSLRMRIAIKEVLRCTAPAGAAGPSELKWLAHVYGGPEQLARCRRKWAPSQRCRREPEATPPPHRASWSMHRSPLCAAPKERPMREEAVRRKLFNFLSHVLGSCARPGEDASFISLSDESCRSGSLKRSPGTPASTVTAATPDRTSSVGSVGSEYLVVQSL